MLLQIVELRCHTLTQLIVSLVLVKIDQVVRIESKIIKIAIQIRLVRQWMSKSVSNWAKR